MLELLANRTDVLTEVVCESSAEEEEEESEVTVFVPIELVCVASSSCTAEDETTVVAAQSSGGSSSSSNTGVMHRIAYVHGKLVRAASSFSSATCVFWWSCSCLCIYV